MSLKQEIAYNLKNIVGKSVKEKYLVIESDDWGSIRMPSLKTFKRLKTKGLSVDKGESKRYNTSDTLASKQDFEHLYDTLSKFKDNDGNHPVFTAVSVVANPDFDKIRANNFEKFEYEPFTTTLERYGQSDALPMWKQGIEEHLFYPEFHGREHLNANVWLRALQKNDKSTRLAFDEGCWGIKIKTPYNINYQAAFDVELVVDIENQKVILSSGLDLFEQIHGYKAKFFVPPNGPFNNQLEKVTAEKGIKYIGAAKVQKEPQGQGKFKNKYHWLGQRNKYGQTYLTRNAFFEPNSLEKDWHSDCLTNIHYAFKWNKPAVISSHRTNYIGSLNPNNRKNSLKALEQLLEEVLKRWPDVKFVTTTQLGEIMTSND